MPKDKIKSINLFFDLLILNYSIFFLSAIQVDIDPKLRPYVSTYLLMGNISWFFSSFLLSTTRFFYRDNYKKRIKRITLKTLMFLVTLSVVDLLEIPHQHSLVFFLECTAIFYLGQISFYQLLHFTFKYKRKKGYNTNRILIIDKNEQTSSLERIISDNPTMGYHFIGYADNHIEHQDVLGTPEQLLSLIKHYHINLVIVPFNLFQEENNAKDYLYLCSDLGVRILFLPENQSNLPFDSDLIRIGELVLINPHKIPLDDLENCVLKRFFDLIFSSLAIIFIFSWLFPIIAILIKINSRGPIFFVQKRTGRKNKTYHIIKFRSMYVNNTAHSKQASTNDHRITGVGEFLRKTYLDELPQFLNVFLGQMSVVGPRPHMLRHTSHFSRMIKNYKFRHIVKPGITGWAQINGYCGETKEIWMMEKRIKYDREYIENWNLWSDINIIWNSIFNLNSYKNIAEKTMAEPMRKKKLEVIL